MNVYFIAVWCSIMIFGCVSVPRHKRQHKIYPVQTLQDLHRGGNNRTALEILEDKFLRKNKNPSIRSLHQKRTFRKKRNPSKKYLKLIKSSHPSTIRLQFESSTSHTHLPVNEDGFSMNGCLSSFGVESPLCRQRKSIEKSNYYKRSYEPEHYFLKSTASTSVKTTVDDFFGLFTHKTQKNRPTTLTSKHVTSATKNDFQISSSLHPTRLAKEKPSQKSTDSSKHTFDNSRGTHNKRLLPVESKLLSDTRMLYLDSGKPNDGKFYRKYDEEEGGGGEVEVETEEHKDSTTHQFPADSIFRLDDNTESSINHVTEGEESSSDHSHETEDEAAPSHEYFEETTHEREHEEHAEETIHSKAHGEDHEVEEDLHLELPNSAKKKCQAETKKKCVCSFASLISSIYKTFSPAVDAKTVLREASHLQCSQYIAKPDSFDLSSASKPKVLSANKKPMAVDGGKGPKELEEHSLDQFIRESVDEEDDEVHVFVNTDVKIPCFPTNDVHLSASGGDHVQYKWSRGNKQPITDGRVTENSDGEGTLLIEETTLADSANYTCEVDYVNPDTGHRTEESFKHPLAVVTLPTVTARATLHLRSTGGCDAGLLELFELYLPQQVETALCGGGEPRLCSVELHSPACHSGSSQESSELSVNLEVYIHRQAERAVTGGNSSGVCDPKCHLVLTLRLLQVFKESLAEIAMTPVNSHLNHGPRTFNPVGNSVRIKYIFGCIGGYHLDGGFCVACPKHTYSGDGDTECSECPAHTYQGSLGARRCIPCTVSWVPACNEYLESQNWFMIVGVAFLVVALFVGFAIWYVVTVKQKRLADVKKLVAETPLTKSKKVKFGKTQKSIRRKQRGNEKAELQSLLESSTDGESDSMVNKIRRKVNNGKNKHTIPLIMTTDATSSE